jgi:hypothetical protein
VRRVGISITLWLGALFKAMTNKEVQKKNSLAVSDKEFFTTQKWTS